MDMVVRSAYAERGHLVLARDATDVGPQARLYFRGDHVAPLPGGKDAMEQLTTIGV
jgi:hypothetical protein